MLPRLLVIVAVMVLVALAAPAIAPDFVASLRPDANVAADEPVPAIAPVRRVTIAADARGHFAAGAAIDGRTVAVVVDTGATVVALTEATARRVGIPLTAASYTATVRTANGVVRAAPVTVGAIALGNVTVRDVAAVVVEGDRLELNLLGMSFLNRLTKFEAGGGQLVLVQ